MRRATPEPRENGWEELRREIEALPFDAHRLEGAPAWVIDRAAVLAIVDRLAAARGEPPEPAFTQNPDVPWRDETLHYPAAARGEPPEPGPGPRQLCLHGVGETDECPECGFGWVAAARGEPGLDVERLARALADALARNHAHIQHETSGFDMPVEGIARAIAAEYDRLGSE